jgi:hypothetical protein
LVAGKRPLGGARVAEGLVGCRSRNHPRDCRGSLGLPLRRAGAGDEHLRRLERLSPRACRPVSTLPPRGCGG